MIIHFSPILLLNTKFLRKNKSLLVQVKINWNNMLDRCNQNYYMMQKKWNFRSNCNFSDHLRTNSWKTAEGLAQERAAVQVDAWNPGKQQIRRTGRPEIFKSSGFCLPVLKHVLLALSFFRSFFIFARRRYMWFIFNILESDPPRSNFPSYLREFAV